MNINNLSESHKKIVRPLYYFFLNHRINYRNFSLRKKQVDYYSTPIIINNFNRLTFLIQLINSLETKGYSNIFILDNKSSYPPLLEFYDRCSYKVYRLNENLGYLALWKSSYFKLFINQFYVYTDSDVVPTRECPSDFMQLFYEKLQSDRRAVKAGFSLKIDDLPDHYKLKQNVLKNEAGYFLERGNDSFYKANIDTTFALYKPGARGGANLYQTMYRSAHPYEARHMPWYVDLDSLDEEELYYIKNVKQSTHWSALSQQNKS